MTILMRACFVAIAAGLLACDTVVMVLEDRYGDPVKRYAHATQPQGLIDVKEKYSYRFLDKWRIGHAWLSGTNVRHCKYLGNSYRRLGGYGELGFENRGSFVEEAGLLGQRIEHKGKWKTSTAFEMIYGTGGRAGKFEKYEPFCVQFFPSSRNGFAVYLVKPDPLKGTNDWIVGAKSVQLNGLNWLVKEIPPEDMTNSQSAVAKPIEIWTLPIPDTAYWLSFSFTASLEHSVQKRPAQHLAMHGLFRQIVASVRLEPIAPVKEGAP